MFLIVVIFFIGIDLMMKWVINLWMSGNTKWAKFKIFNQLVIYKVFTSINSDKLIYF